ncbi:FecR family protein [Mixta sp. Marseille-Q2659]|uniref:FecR family protein n=1 Tax=Mixta sp. Marseille-Q2659 TaxID=2736607 RepID=UPI0023B8B694|nr:FecR family protein [Mixta sp. Marseille-Q2659]
MINIMKLFIFLVLMLLATGVNAAQEKVAVVKKTEHTCRVTASTCELLSSGSSVFEGDILQTGKNGYAGLSFSDGTTVALDANSQFKINKYTYTPLKNTYSFDVLLSRGSAIYASGRLGKLSPSSVKFKTPTTIIAVRGTRFLVTVN